MKMLITLSAVLTFEHPEKYFIYRIYICIIVDVALECNCKDAENSLGKETAWSLNECGSYHRRVNVTEHCKREVNKSLGKLVEAKFKQMYMT